MTLSNNSNIIINDVEYHIIQLLSNRKGNRISIYYASTEEGDKFIIKEFKRKAHYRCEYEIMSRIEDADVIPMIFDNTARLIVMPKGTVIEKIRSTTGRYAAAKATAAAIASLHKINYVHRDINMSNIVYLNDNVNSIRLIDFELATPIGSKIKKWGGTAGYVPVDFCFATDAVTEWLDIYAYAVTLLHLFTNFKFKSIVTKNLSSTAETEQYFYTLNTMHGCQLSLIHQYLSSAPPTITDIIVRILTKKDTSITMHSIYNILGQ